MKRIKRSLFLLGFICDYTLLVSSWYLGLARGPSGPQLVPSICRYGEQGIGAMKIYLAGKLTSKPLLKLARKELQDMGHTVTSRWLDYDDETQDEYKKAQFALRDLEDITASNCFILYAGDEPADGGGRECEWGYALSRMSIPHRLIVGIKRNVFHRLCTQQFNDWNECLAWMGKLT